MATPKKRYKYNVVYKDGTFLDYDLTRTEYDQISQHIVDGKQAIKISFGTLSLSDVRSIVEQKLPEEEPENPNVSLFEQHGIDTSWMDTNDKEYVSKMLNRIYEKDDDDNDTEQ